MTKEGQSASQPAEPTASRRGFLWKLWLGLGAVALVEYLWVFLEFLRPRRAGARQQPSAIVVAGPVERFDKGSVTAFPEGKFYLARLEDGGFLALHRECTHLGCTVPWVADEGRFVCPCHASAFDLRGDVVSPPAPHALNLFPVRIENRIVKVDTSQVIRREAFEATQVALP